MRHCVIAVLLLLITKQARPQSENAEAHFSILSSVGLLYGGYTAWSFYGESDPVLTKPGLAIGIGGMYGPFAVIEGAELSTSLEASFGQMRTHAQSDKFEMVLQRLPVISWLTFDTDHALSPYGRIGVGLCMTDFQETYSDTFYPSLHFHEWTFSWGFGTGLRYRCSPTVDVAIFWEQWTTEGKIVEQNFWGDQRGINAPYGDNPVGFRLIYRL